MRQLTKNEIDNAPEGCNMYYILESGKVGYCFSKSNAAWGCYAPIPRKEFDISEHEFSNKNISRVFCDSEVISTIFSITTLGTKETRDDIILKAKHFKLTADDLHFSSQTTKPGKA